MPTRKPELELVTCSFPTPHHPYYHTVLRASGVVGADRRVDRVEANGKWVRDLSVYSDGAFRKDRTLPAGAVSTIVVRLDWRCGEANRVVVKLAQAGGADSSVDVDFTSPAEGGWWNAAWKYCAGLVLRENRGIAREREPVHVSLGVYADRLQSPEQEVRVVGIDPVSGVQTEAPSQVYGASTWSGASDERVQPTTTFSVAFLADVPAYGSKVYLVFYGNPAAKAPAYPSDLVISGEGMGLTVENPYYRVALAPYSGAIDEILLKQGVNALFDHHLETNGALHWNPDVYAPPRQWLHASDWIPPDNYAVEQGPIFCMTKRWGSMPHYPEVLCSITYVFYAGNPHFLVDSTMEVTRDLDVVALRNGEIVINHKVAKEFAWERPDGEVGTVVVTDLPRHPTPALEIEGDAPWFALYNRDLRAALGVVDVETANMRMSQGLMRADPYRYLHWGPWIYCCRPLVYSFVTNNPQRVQRVHAHSMFYEKMAVLPFRLGETDEERFEPIQARQAALADPLDVRAVHDTDERVPTEWVPPILVAEFEEL